MHYEKPEVMELNARARVTGQTPMACVSGLGADGVDETCAVGVGAGWACATGEGGNTFDTCVGGSLPGGGVDDCFAGTDAYFCAAGSVGEIDPLGCRSGPAPLP